MTARTENPPSLTAPAAATDALGLGSTASLLADLRGSDRSGEAGAAALRTRKRLSGLSLITLFVIASSAAALWGMRYYGTRAGMRLDNVSFELSTASDESTRARNHQQLLQALSRSGMTAQLAGAPVDKNPFFLTNGPATPNTPYIPGDPNAHAAGLLAEAQARRLLDIQNAFAGLTLHSIVGGSFPVANINDQMVTIGDRVAEFFTVKAIVGRTVELESESGPLVLNMDTGPVEKPAQKLNRNPVKARGGVKPN